MNRRIFTILSAVSLVLCIATGVLWVRSYWRSDYLWLRTSRATAVRFTSPEQRDAFERVKVSQGWAAMYDHGYVATAFRGGRCYFFFAPRERSFTPRHDSLPPWITGGTDASETLMLQKRPLASLGVGQVTAWDGMGLSYYHISLGPGIDVRRASAPAWLLCLLMLLLPMLYVRRWMARRRALRSGLCLNCGYDLRASTERCPECGIAFANPLARVDE